MHATARQRQKKIKSQKNILNLKFKVSVESCYEKNTKQAGRQAGLKSDILFTCDLKKCNVYNQKNYVMHFW